MNPLVSERKSDSPRFTYGAGSDGGNARRQGVELCAVGQVVAAITLGETDESCKPHVDCERDGSYESSHSCRY